MNDNNQWAESVIIADAAYIDRVAFDLTVNFERMIGRRIPPADLAKWLECVALDGGLLPGPQSTDVVLIHDKGRTALKYFVPADFATELNGQAFSGNLGEFRLSTVSAEGFTSSENLFCDVVQMVCQSKQTNRLMLIPDEHYAQMTMATLDKSAPADCLSTLFSMQPLPLRTAKSELLGYSLMAALGIRGDEIPFSNDENG